jgi:hypothetical protein
MEVIKMLCLKCNKQLPEVNPLFCTYCGEKVPEKQTAPQGELCGGCGSKWPENGGDFCPKCGSKKADIQAQASFCTHCGGAITSDAAFCTHCGKGKNADMQSTDIEDDEIIFGPLKLNGYPGTFPAADLSSLAPGENPLCYELVTLPDLEDQLVMDSATFLLTDRRIICKRLKDTYFSKGIVHDEKVADWKIYLTSIRSVDNYSYGEFIEDIGEVTQERLIVQTKDGETFKFTFLVTISELSEEQIAEGFVGSEFSEEQIAAGFAENTYSIIRYLKRAIAQ